MEFDEKDAIAFIRGRLPHLSGDINDDEILNVIDIIWDYYDENGFLDLDLSDDGPDDLDTADLIAYAQRLNAKDRQSPMTTEDIEAIVKAELDYEDSLED
ncbi:MAG: hypothetical protein NC102_01210 [Clostridium sp.]|nr:hypothetical protein [Clostridium sp.]